MSTAAKEEMHSPPTATRSVEEIFSLAALFAVSSEPRIGANAPEGKKPHPGIFSRNRTIAVGATWAKWPGTHQVSGRSWPKTVLGIAIDANGNTLSDASGKQYTWDFENRLTQAVVPGTNGGTTIFKYDPFGRRIQKSGPLGTTNYLYDGINLLVETDSAGNVLAKYSNQPGIDQPLSELRSGSPSYYEQDTLGSVTSLSDVSGVLANTYTFDGFGKQTSSSGSLTNPFRYTGREFDQETGIDYYRFRYYDPSVGRFISEDPIRYGGGGDFYAYVGNNATSYIDPSGLSPSGPPGPPPLKPPPIYYPGGGSWNGDGQSTNNCYSYGCDRLHPPGNPHAPQPGEDSGVPHGRTCATIKAAAEADGVLDGQGGSCPCNYHKVKLYIGEHVHDPTQPYRDLGWDYHWIREDAYGGWSSKHGLGPVGPQVSDPDLDALIWGYDQPCGMMCARNQ
jgi:RHS repeat-associated protein